MTSNIIYHDFRSANAQPKAVLTGAVLTKGRRRLKTWASINSVLRIACVFLNTLCIACSLFSICWIALFG